MSSRDAILHVILSGGAAPLQAPSRAIDAVTVGAHAPSHLWPGYRCHLGWDDLPTHRLPSPPGSYSTLVVDGATRALGAHTATVAALATSLAPGGQALISFESPMWDADTIPSWCAQVGLLEPQLVDQVAAADGTMRYVVRAGAPASRR